MIVFHPTTRIWIAILIKTTCKLAYQRDILQHTKSDSDSSESEGDSVQDAGIDCIIEFASFYELVQIWPDPELCNPFFHPTAAHR